MFARDKRLKKSVLLTMAATLALCAPLTASDLTIGELRRQRLADFLRDKIGVTARVEVDHALRPGSNNEVSKEEVLNCLRHTLQGIKMAFIKFKATYPSAVIKTLDKRLSSIFVMLWGYGSDESELSPSQKRIGGYVFDGAIIKKRRGQLAIYPVAYGSYEEYGSIYEELRKIAYREDPKSPSDVTIADVEWQNEVRLKKDLNNKITKAIETTRRYLNKEISLDVAIYPVERINAIMVDESLTGDIFIILEAIKKAFRKFKATYPPAIVKGLGKKVNAIRIHLHKMVDEMDGERPVAYCPNVKRINIYNGLFNPTYGYPFGCDFKREHIESYAKYILQKLEEIME